MPWLLTMLLLLLSLPAAAKERGFDPPIQVKTRSLGLSRDVVPPQKILETCRIYQGFSLVWKEDPSIKGIEKVIVREGKDPAKLCGAVFSGSSRSLSLEGGWPIGVAGPYLFVEDEPLGDMATFYVLELATGKKVFKSWRDVQADLSIEKKGEIVGLNYRMGLELPCSPSKNDPSCWEKVKTANHIPQSVAVGAPDCEKAFQQAPFTRTTPRGLAVTVPVKVSDLAHPQIISQKGTALCVALP